MEEKVFKKQSEYEQFIENCDQNTFYKLHEVEKTLFHKFYHVLLFNNKDIEDYLIEQFHKFLDFFGIKDFNEKIRINENKIFIKFSDENENSVLLQNHGFVISAIQNLLAVYLFNYFTKWFQITINANNKLHSQKFFLKKIVFQAFREVSKNKQPFHFKPMPNDQRKIIHELVKATDQFTTYSEGKGFSRHIVLLLKENEPELSK